MSRTLAAIIVLLFTLIAWGCSSSDGDGAQSAASLTTSDFQLTSANFTEIRPKKRIPDENTCHGENLSPPLSWKGVPEGTKSLAIIAEDIDHHTGVWVHWVLYNVPPFVTELSEGIPTSTDELPDGTTQGANDHKNIGYQGPCPVPVVIFYSSAQPDIPIEPAHNYVFTLYALSSELGLAPGANKGKLLSAMKGHILAQAEVVGKYQVRPVTPQKQDIGRSIQGSYGDTASSTTPVPTPTP